MRQGDVLQRKMQKKQLDKDSYEEMRVVSMHYKKWKKLKK